MIGDFFMLGIMIPALTIAIVTFAWLLSFRVFVDSLSDCFNAKPEPRFEEIVTMGFNADAF